MQVDPNPMLSYLTAWGTYFLSIYSDFLFFFKKLLTNTKNGAKLYIRKFYKDRIMKNSVFANAYYCFYYYYG